MLVLRGLQLDGDNRDDGSFGGTILFSISTLPVLLPMGTKNKELSWSDFFIESVL